MAIDLCSDSSTLNMSPRYSFSHDISSKPDNILPIDHHDLLRPSFDSQSNLDFDFNVRQSSLDHDSSSADELFSDGMIRSLQINKDAIIADNSSSSSKQKEHKPKSPKNISVIKKTYIPRSHTFHDHDDNHDLKTALESSENQKQNSSKSSSSSSFWRFKRSTSLNCGSGGYASSLCPLPLLSRSNSAGSASIDSSTSTKRNHQKPPPPSSLKHSSSSFVGPVKSNAAQGYSSSSNYQKPPLKKGVYGSYGSNNTLLHVPSASIFGFGSIFSNGKAKNNKATR